jgi:hypothetical protein
MWKIEIEKYNNGYKVNFKGGDTKNSVVYQEKDEGLEENKEHIVEMLYDILEYFSEQGSKHDKKRLFIEWKLQ